MVRRVLKCFRRPVFVGVGSSAILLAATLVCLPPFQAQSALTLALDPVVSGLTQPVFVTHAGDGSGRLFIVEQAGRIRIFQNGSLLAVPFLDIRPLVTSGGETGLLSVAFHPDYRNNRRFFVNYTASRPNLKTIVAEYQASSGNPNIAETAERVVLEVDQPFSNHNGGQLHFGPDGYLYIGMGDGGSGGDPQNHAQNLNSLLGKLLRIDVNGAQPYAIPPDNPFVNIDGRDEIWAYGLRNPWRFSFDLANGRLFLADVGQGALEEVDLVVRAGNYGWRIMEGSRCFSPSTGCNTSGLILPINEYGRTLGISVTGGYVYRGSQFPELAGTYLFGDFGSGRIWGLAETNRGDWIRTEFLRPGFNISSFGEDEAGEIYVVNYGGSILRVRVANPQPPLNPVSLIPSSVRSDRFTSLFSVVNRESATNNLRVTAYRDNGSVSGTLDRVLPPGGAFRSDDILGELGLPLGSFGPIAVESTNGRRFDAVSEVAANSGTAGFFAGQSVARASNERLIAEVIDSGDRGQAGTFRTNLGINNPGGLPATVTLSLFDGGGGLRGTRTAAVPARGMLQIDKIASVLAGSSASLPITGYLRLDSDQPIHAWASKIDNGTDDPSLQVALGNELSETSTRLLIPSVAGTDRFKSLLVVVNREPNEMNQILITARDNAGNILGTLARTLPVAGSFRSLDILADIGAPLGSFGPLSIESTTGKLFSAISEVRSTDGTAGFFPAVSPVEATLQRVIAEVVDSGERGVPNTFRTNLGVNNPGPSAARITLQVIDDAGEVEANSQTITVPANGMVQLDGILRNPVFLLNRAVTRAYLKISSDQAIHAWASKINNGTNDPSIVLAFP